MPNFNNERFVSIEEGGTHVRHCICLLIYSHYTALKVHGTIFQNLVFCFRFHLKNHHSKDVNWKIWLKWSSRGNVTTTRCTATATFSPIQWNFTLKFTQVKIPCLALIVNLRSRWILVWSWFAIALWMKRVGPTSHFQGILIMHIHSPFHVSHFRGILIMHIYPFSIPCFDRKYKLVVKYINARLMNTLPIAYVLFNPLTIPVRSASERASVRWCGLIKYSCDCWICEWARFCSDKL